MSTLQDTQAPAATPRREQMNIVVIGHVDHGKSTVVGRLLADTGSLPEGKLEHVRRQCERNAKPFEYAFLLDALKDEQAQGITIDSARCFFKSRKREYIIIDAPGHVEFLKNMISGAARAEAGLLIIDAKEGVLENSRRHGYLASMLGIRQIAVCINKMDLVDYDRKAFEALREEYSRFLESIGVRPTAFIPLAARHGQNMIEPSPLMPWYEGPTVLGMLDSFRKEAPPTDKALRMPVQDVYKFTGQEDDRRIFAGRIETGRLAVDDEVVFYPSGKRSRIASIEAFNRPAQQRAIAGQSTGVTLAHQVYIKPGEVMCKAGDAPPRSTTRLQVNLFWLSRQPMIKGKRYKIKLGTARSAAWLTDIETVLDASDLTSSQNRQQIDRHDVAQCTIQTLRPIACDEAGQILQTGRFVIIDNYEIAGGGVILGAEQATNTLAAEHVRQREQAWVRTSITTGIRAGRYGQRPALVLISGPAGTGKRALATALEEYLFNSGRLVYYLGVSNSLLGIDADMRVSSERDEYIRRLGEMAHVFTDAGMIFITTISDLDDDELDVIDTLNRPNELVVVNVGENRFSRRTPDLILEEFGISALQQVRQLLSDKNYLLEYYL